MRISDWSSDVCSSDLIIHIRIADDRQNRPERLLVHNGGAFLDIPHYCQRNKIARTFGHVATCDDLAARTCALQIAEYLVILRLVLDWTELRLRITAPRYLRSSGISDDLFAHRVLKAEIGSASGRHGGVSRGSTRGTT